MNYYQFADDFLFSHNQHPDQISIDEITRLMLTDMENGLNGQKSSLMMIPTYLTASTNFHSDESVIVIDAGGTNLRIAALDFSEGKPKILKYEKKKMLGTDETLSWRQFISQLTDLLIPYLTFSKKIGFCFSFPAEILPNKDGKVLSFCKEVNITDCKNKILGEEIRRELTSRHLSDDIQIVVLNDTVATLLGGTNTESDQHFDGHIGLILGTGTNTAYVEKRDNIKKLSFCATETMIINMESGMFDKVPQGDFDKIVDCYSNNPHDHKFEKMISGVYLGNVIAQTIKQADIVGLFSEKNKIRLLPDFSMVEVDSFLRHPFGNNLLSEVCQNLQDKELLFYFIDKAIERSSKLVCANLAADILQMNGGKKRCMPTQIVIEGSTYHKCYSYKEKIGYYMHNYINNQLQRYYFFDSGEDVNLIGSGKAALINL
ncbi:MAG: hexokinase [Erysipelotrichia bacterium]|nr:hexokinase [Erysipelotrichia bacterium]